MSVEKYHPRGLVGDRLELDKRKERHAALNTLITERGGWLTSIAGSTTMRFEAVPGSPLPDDLRALGYVVTLVGTTQRIIPHAITVEIAAERTSMPPLRCETHAGVVEAIIYEMKAP